MTGRGEGLAPRAPLDRIRDVRGVFTLAVMVTPHLHPVPKDSPDGRSRPRAGFSSSYTIRVELVGSAPPVWRRFRCPSDLRLDELHQVLQTVMGWTNSHLHQFTFDTVPGRSAVDVYDPRDPYAEPDPGAVPEDTVRADRVLRSIGETVEYLYDFGDSWEHVLTLEGISDRAPEDRAVQCLAGERLAPPENVGGIGFYEDLLEALRQPAQWRHPDMVEALEWTGQTGRADTFDVDDTNKALDRDARSREALEGFEEHRLGNAAPVVLAGIMVRLGADARLHLAGFFADTTRDTAEPETLEVMVRRTFVMQGLLDGIGQGGVTLTAAGYLPPATVAAVMAATDPGKVWVGARNREIDIPPLAALREAAAALGLTRKSDGRLMLTLAGRKARRHPQVLWDHIASRIPVERGSADREIGVLGLLLIGAGILPGTDQFGDTLGVLAGMAGWQTRSGARIDGATLFQRAELTGLILEWAATGILVTAGYPRPGEAEPVSVPLARAAFSR